VWFGWSCSLRSRSGLGVGFDRRDEIDARRSFYEASAGDRPCCRCRIGRFMVADSVLRWLNGRGTIRTRATCISAAAQVSKYQYYGPARSRRNSALTDCRLCHLPSVRQLSAPPVFAASPAAGDDGFISRPCTDRLPRSGSGESVPCRSILGLYRHVGCLLVRWNCSCLPRHRVLDRSLVSPRSASSIRVSAESQWPRALPRMQPMATRLPLPPRLPCSAVGSAPVRLMGWSRAV